MTNRRDFIKSGVALSAAPVVLGSSPGAAAADTGAAELGEEPPLRTTAVVGVVEPQVRGWRELDIVDVDRFPVDKHPRYHSKSKTFFVGPSEGFLIYTVFPPTFSTKMPPAGMAPHFHYYHEWGYALQGDYLLGEPVNPYQKNGMLYHYRQGTWLSRPPHTLHGGTWENGGGIRAQDPYHLLIMEEGDGSVVSVGPHGDHIFPDFPDKKPHPYRPDWKAVKNFNRPAFVEAERDMEWETDPEVPGRFIKWLSDDVTGGFRAQLVKIPPGWQAPANAGKTYFANANRLRFMIYGSMAVWSFRNPQDRGRPYMAREHTFVYQAPRTLWGFGSGEVTKEGAVWLEVTYAKGLTWGGGPIENPIQAA